MVKGAGVTKGGGVHGKGGGKHGRGRVWQERRPLQWTLRILLECILLVTCVW